MSNTEQVDMSDTPDFDGQPAGFPGHILRQAREGLGLSQMEVARELHLTSKVINAIEESEFDVIPSFVFARGYIRSYARHLGLDGQGLVAQFDAAYGAPDQGSKPMKGIRKVDQQIKPSDTWVKLVSVLFVVGLVAVSLMWWQSQNGGLALSQLTSVTIDTPEGETVIALGGDDDEGLDLASLSLNTNEVTVVAPVSAAKDEAEVSQNVIAEEVTAAVEEEVVVSEATQVAQAASTASVVAPAKETLAANQAVLVMVFEKDCWVEIKDGNGKMILSDLYSAGDQIDQVVEAPIEVLLGRSSAVSNMTFNGRVIDLKPHTRKDIARLTLKK